VDDAALYSGIDCRSFVRKIDDGNERGAIEVVQGRYCLEKPLQMTQIDDMIKHLDTEMEYKEVQALQRSSS